MKDPVMRLALLLTLMTAVVVGAGYLSMPTPDYDVRVDCIPEKNFCVAHVTAPEKFQDAREFTAETFKNWSGPRSLSIELTYSLEPSNRQELINGSGGERKHIYVYPSPTMKNEGSWPPVELIKFVSLSDKYGRHLADVELN